MIQNEVAILRRVKHPNIVLLIEEVDTYSELYLVMELVKVNFLVYYVVSKLIQDSDPTSGKVVESYAVIVIHYNIERKIPNIYRQAYEREAATSDLNPALKNSVNLSKYK